MEDKAKLVVLAQSGDEEAFQKLMKADQNKLYKIAYTYVHNENDAVEIVQETFYKAYLSIKQLKEPSYYSTWLTKILINNALSFIKKQKRFVFLPDFLDQQQSNAEEHSVENLDLLDAIRALPTKYKTVINLRFYMDYSHAQIAGILSIPEGTVKTRIHRATKRLEKWLREDDAYDTLYKENYK